MKKWVFSLIGIVVMSGFMLGQLLPNEYDVLKSSWQVDIPKADEVQDLLSTESSFNGDGEWVTLFHYNEPIESKLDSFQKLTDENVSAANNRMVRFKNKVIAIRQQDPAIIQLFDSHPMQATAGDYYYYTAKANGNDFIIMLYKSELQQLYYCKWTQ